MRKYICFSLFFSSVLLLVPSSWAYNRQGGPASQCDTLLNLAVQKLLAEEFMGEPIFRIEYPEVYYSVCGNNGGNALVFVLVLAKERPYAVWNIAFGNNPALVSARNVSGRWKFADMKPPWWYMIAQEEMWKNEWCSVVQKHSPRAFIETGCK